MVRSDSLGLESGRVLVVPYSPQWPVLFEEAASELREALNDSVLAIHHVGSTAVPGLAAKPILDILVTVPDFEDGLLLTAPLAECGYEYRPDEEIPDRHYFRRRRGTARTHHLSLAERTSRHAITTLGFRDALREDRDLAQAYEELKRKLAERYPNDREAYLNGKSDFVQAVLKQRGLSDVVDES